MCGLNMLTPEIEYMIDLVEEPRRLELLYVELVQECRHNAPGARFSARLRHDIERLRPSTRRELVSTIQDGCAPLWMAAHRGAAELVEYLAHVCGAPLEQTGALRGPGGEHRAPALWAAAVGGHVETVRVLIAAGAEVDARSDTGSTALRSACFMSHGAVAKLLLKSGADACSSNYSGGTCLINAVQSAYLTEMLLKHGADPTAADTQLKTPLHYAAQEHRSDTARLLLHYGADPTFKSRAGDDALRTAAIKGASTVLRVIAAAGPYTAEEVADAHELLGSSYLHELGEARAARSAWRRGTALRLVHCPPLEKRRPECEVPPMLAGIQEWRTPDELETLTRDSDGLQAQAMLVALRVLGPWHNNFISRVMGRGACLGELRHYRKGIEMWIWALDLRIRRDTLLFSDSCVCACSATKLVAEGLNSREEIPLELVVELYTVIATGLPECVPLMLARPVCRSQASSMDRAMRCLAHLMLLILHTQPEEMGNPMVSYLEEQTRPVIALDVRSALTGDSLLHMMVSALTTIHNDMPGLYPEGSDELSVLCGRGVALLLRSGADVNARNLSRCTALHVAALTRAARAAAAPLLRAGAHLDTPSRHADTPATMLQRYPNPPKPLHYMNLSCFAANTIIQHNVHVAAGALPRHLRTFLELHRP